MSETQKQKPFHKIRFGRLSASFWKHTNRDGREYISVTFQRVRKDDGEWVYSDLFFREDLLTISRLAEEAFAWLLSEENQGQNVEHSSETEVASF